MKVDLGREREREGDEGVKRVVAEREKVDRGGEEGGVGGIGEEKSFFFFNFFNTHVGSY